MSGALASHSPKSLAEGARLGRYEVERQLGSGGMGVVLAVRHAETGARLAMKVLHARLARDPDVRERFLREGATASMLESDHVVRVHEVGVLPSGQPFIVMERLAGLDMEQLLARSGPLPIPFVIDIALQACAALREAHSRGVVHRDLKPANLFLARTESGRARIKIVDFGVSRAAWQEPGLTLTRTALGSPPYMAPEQIMSSKDVDARADVWSFGVTLYELLTGVLPFPQGTIPALVAAILGEAPAPLEVLRSDVPPALAAVVARCLSKDPNRRYANVGLLEQDLIRARWSHGTDDGDEPTRVLPTRSSRPPEPSSDRLVWVAALTMLMAVAMLVILALEAGLFRLEG